ncbi:MAG TPA: hypothetical protein ENK57_09060 [Polyangiaceae bacterium]|nr:hypothetical protein [Polyangiaceae bacterium]
MAQPEEERSRWRDVARRVAFLLVVAGVGLTGASLSDHLRGRESLTPVATASAPLTVEPSAHPAPDPPAEVESPWWLAIGGGADPVSNQVSIEQDLALAARVLGPAGILMYAGGLGASPVHELGEGTSRDLHGRLGALFAPRDGRRARYRPTRLRPHAAATAEDASAMLRRLVRRSGEPPLLLVVVAHGDPGKTARDNRVPLWGGGAIEVGAMAEQLDAIAAPRPLRAVVTTCFSGGFGELVFADGKPEKGATEHDRCGLFAATWDTEASGCDPNPDRRAQESYGLHFFRALEGKDRSGADLPLEQLDYDGDGRVSLLEAHTRVRVASRAFSVPTTTSERWLAHAAPKSGPDKPMDMPEEEAVITALGEELDVPDEIAGRRRYGEGLAASQRLDDTLRAMEEDTDDAYGDLRIALLERWPVLDDPYHPHYAETLDQDGEAITRFLDESPVANAYFGAAEAEVPIRQELDQLDVELALLERLVRAYAIRAAAGRLNHRGGPALATYQRLLACERWVPPTK